MTKASVKRNALVSLPGILILLALPFLFESTPWFQTNGATISFLMNCFGTIFVFVLGFGVISPVIFTVLAKPASHGTLNWLKFESARNLASYFEITDWEKR